VLLLGAATALRLGLLHMPLLWPDESVVATMGLAVLRGELPVYYYGQPHMGALHAYLVAPLYVLLGRSALAIELLSVVVTVAWLAVMARLAWATSGPRAALFVTALLALPPNLLLYWSHEARPQYLLTLLFGSLALLLTRDLSALSPARVTLAVALAGGLLGLALWTNFLAVVYGPALAFLVVPVLVRRRLVDAALAGLLAFGLGSFPHWLYGLAHGTALPAPDGPIGGRELVAHLDSLARVSWPALAGVPAPWRDTPAGIGLALLLALAYAVAAVVAFRKSHRVGRWMNVALWAIVAADVAVTAGTPYGRFLPGPDQRLLLPLYTALPLFLAQSLSGLAGTRAALLTAALLLVHLADATTPGDVRVFAALRGLPGPAAAMQAGQAPTLTALDQAGLRRLYADDPWTRALTFVSGERIIWSDPYQEMYPPYARAVDGAETVGWWSRGPSPVLESTLAAAGIGFRYRATGPLGGAYGDFTRPSPPLRELDPGQLRVTTSEGAGPADWMTDRDARTVWGTARPKRGGEWIEVDVGAVEPVALIRWLPGTYQEVPDGLTLDVSTDGRGWQRVLDVPAYEGPLYWSAGRPIARVRGGRVELKVPATPARRLRITQTGRHPTWRWTVRELFVYGAGAGEPPDPPRIERVVERLRAAGVTRLYTDAGWGSRIALADPAVQVPPANLALDAYGFLGAAEDFLAPFRWGPGRAVLLEPADAPGFATAARASGLGIAEASLGGLTLFTSAGPPADAGAPIPAGELSLSASREAGQAPLAIDADPGTRWATARPQAPGDWVRVDLASARRVRAVRLWSGQAADWPRGLALEASADGASWRPLAPEVRTEGRLRWGGVALLRDGIEAVRLDFAPVVVRALRLVLTRGDPVFDWSIHELTVYGD
jgi:hypothetical protein